AEAVVIALVVVLVQVDADEANVAVLFDLRFVALAVRQVAVPAEPDTAIRAQCAQHPHRETPGGLVFFARARDTIGHCHDAPLPHVAHSTSSQVRLNRIAPLMIPAML